MIRRRLGGTDLMVSPIGLGTVKIGRTGNLKYPHPFSLPSDAEAAALLAAAADLGVNLIDTAPAYGASEERLGVLLRATGSSDWIVSTKVGEAYDPANGRSTFDFTPENARRSVERSLSRLRVEALDIVLVHSDGGDAEILRGSGIFDALRSLRVEGKIRYFGMSSKTVEGGLLALAEADCAMVTYNSLRQDEAVVIDRAADLGKGVIVKKPLASGGLVLGGAGDALRDSLGLVLGRRGVDAAVVGTIDPKHLGACVAACEGLERI